MDLTNYKKAGFPFLFVETFEIKRAIKIIEIDEIIGDQQQIKYFWNIHQGIWNINGGDEYQDPFTFLKFIEEQNNSIFYLENFDQLLKSEVEFAVGQYLLNIMDDIKKNQNMIIMIGTEPNFPAFFEKMITIVEFNLPTKEEFRKITKDICEQTGLEYNESVADACVGLSLEEGDNAIAKSIVDNKKLDKQNILDMKRQMIKKTGFLDFMAPVSIDMIGGLDNAKEYMIKRKEAWNNDSKPKLRSVLLAGLSGTGKTLFGKLISSIFDLPLIIFDINAAKGSLVGETEKNIRLATKTIDAFSGSIILIDEIEKILAGATGNVQDSSGVSQGILGHLLTWMQESQGEKIIVATANNITSLPPEFMRRFDVQFFVGYPNKRERKEIIKIMNKRYGSKLPTNDEFIDKLDKWTGAEIEVLSKDSLFEDLEHCINNVPLLKNTKMDEMKEIERITKGMRKASKEDNIIEHKYTRKIASEKSESIVDENMKINLKKILLKRKSEE
jgi:AAA+ superfamily predicted ATPase